MRKVALRYRVMNVLTKFGGNRMKTVEVMGVIVMVGDGHGHSTGESSGLDYLKEVPAKIDMYRCSTS